MFLCAFKLQISFDISLPVSKKKKERVCVCVCVSGKVCANGHLNVADVMLNSLRALRSP